MKRAVAWILRVRTELHCRALKKKSHVITRNENKLPKSIMVQELNQAGIALIKYVQLSSLPQAIVQRGKDNLPRNMCALCPIVDEDGLVRVGPRRNYRSEVEVHQ